MNPKRKKWLKRGLILGLVAVTVVSVALIATSRGASKSLYQMAMNNISEARFFMKQAQSANHRVQFFSGLREADYNLDGVASGTVAFALLNVEPRNITNIDDQELTGTLRIGEETMEITLERNQFGRNFAADIGKQVDASVTITFTLNVAGAIPVAFDLQNAMADEAIGWEEALRIGAEHLSDKIRNAASFESYVKIITDRESISAFWFVQFITNTGESHFVVVNTDGSIVGDSLNSNQQSAA